MAYPIKDIWIISPFFTPSSVKLPSISVIVPLVVPFITTDAPATGPKASSTTPVTFAFCWEMSVFGLPALEAAYIFPEKHNVLASKTMLTGLILFNITNVFCLIYDTCLG